MQILNPLFDPANIDPDSKHIKAFLESIEQDGYEVGTVCDVYELCGHLLCAASYNLWMAIEDTKKALNE